MIPFARMLTYGNKLPPKGEMMWVQAGTFEFIVPDDVESICILCVGGGGRVGTGSTGGGGGGGGLSYRNEVVVTPGEVLSVTVGVNGYTANSDGGNSYVLQNNSNVCIAGGGKMGSYGTTMSGGAGGAGGVGGKNASQINDGGGNGGRGGSGPTSGTYRYERGGSGGAGGYEGNGGAGASSSSGSSGSGGGGGGGGIAASGGAVGLFGMGESGRGSAAHYRGSSGSAVPGTTVYRGAGNTSTDEGLGGVRIIWGGGRRFPSNNVGPTT